MAVADAGVLAAGKSRPHQRSAGAHRGPHPPVHFGVIGHVLTPFAVGLADMKMNQRGASPGGRDRVVGDLFRRIANMRIGVLHRDSVDRGLDLYFRHGEPPQSCYCGLASKAAREHQGAPAFGQASRPLDYWQAKGYAMFPKSPPQSRAAWNKGERKWRDGWPAKLP